MDIENPADRADKNNPVFNLAPSEVWTYPCGNCDFGTEDKFALKVHNSEYHMGIKVYQCKVQGCGKKYDLKDSFTHHKSVAKDSPHFEKMLYRQIGQSHRLSLVRPAEKIETIVCRFPGHIASASKNSVTIFFVAKLLAEIGYVTKLDEFARLDLPCPAVRKIFRQFSTFTVGAIGNSLATSAELVPLRINRKVSYHREASVDKFN